jgi:hypothetical protein
MRSRCSWRSSAALAGVCSAWPTSSTCLFIGARSSSRAASVGCRSGSSSGTTSTSTRAPTRPARMLRRLTAICWRATRCGALQIAGIWPAGDFRDVAAAPSLFAAPAALPRYGFAYLVFVAGGGAVVWALWRRSPGLALYVAVAVVGVVWPWSGGHHAVADRQGARDLLAGDPARRPRRRRAAVQPGSRAGRSSPASSCSVRWPPACCGRTGCSTAT